MTLNPARVFLALFLLCSSVLAVPVCAAARGNNGELTADGRPNIKSSSALVIDLHDDAVLYAKDADLVRPIASISKLFGSLVLIEECKLDPAGMHEMTQSNREAARGGDKTKLTTGWSYSNRDLLHAALMRSDNRALPALAEACGLTPTAFAAKMTAKARQLGLTKTSFKEPDGLSPDNVSTAREVVVALKAALKVPELTEIMSKADFTIVAHKGERSREIKIHNTDRLLSRNTIQILAGKTGYTDIARYCLAVAARTSDGREVAMVFLGAEGRFTRFADFTRVIYWLARQGAVPQSVQAVVGGATVQPGTAQVPKTPAGAITGSPAPTGTVATQAGGTAPLPAAPAPSPPPAASDSVPAQSW